MPKNGQLTPQHLADLGLAYLAEDADRLAEFMVASGYTPDALRAAVGSEHLALGVIDYFAQNEHLLLALCAHRGLRAEDFMRVWARLNPAG